MNKNIFVKEVCLKLVAVFGVVIILAFCGLLRISAQSANSDTKVTKITADTEDLISFQVSIPKTIFLRGEDILIKYQVTNKSNKTVYLVTEPSPNVLIEDISTMRVVEPVSGVDDHIPYNYDLITIKPQKTFSGQLLISAKYYIQNKNYNFGIAEIQVGFSYLFDKQNLDGCKEVTFVRPCLKELNDKSKSLTVGNLVIEIKKQ
jgi:hypothetical protein